MNELQKTVFLTAEAQFDSDLAMERKKVSTYVEGVDYKRDVSIGGVWERLKITSEEGAKNIGRPIGLYDTLTVPRMDNILPEDVEDAKDEVARELCRIFDLCDIMPQRILVVGLGNKDLTPDAVGPEAANEVEATLHIKNADEALFDSLACSEICILRPDVPANTGMSSADIVKSVCDSVKPSAVIAIDSLASRSSERLGNTIQISNTGIFPSLGVGNNASKIDEELLGVPVVAIGVPTVVNSRYFLRDKSTDGSTEANGMFLSPKGINRIVKNAGKIIGGGINQAFGMCYF